MTDKRVAGVAAVTTVVLAAVQFGTDVMAARLVGSVTRGTALPLFGSIGQSAVVYSILLQTLAPLFTAGATLAVGVYLGRHVDVRMVHRDLLRGVAVGSGAVVALGGLAALVTNGITDAYAVAFALATVLRLGGTFTVPLLVGSLAGAALVAFETSDARDGDGRESAHTAEPEHSREYAAEDA